MRHLSTRLKGTGFVDLIGPTHENLDLINGYSISKCSLVVNLNIGTSFVDTGALSIEILMMKVQHLLAYPNKS